MAALSAHHTSTSPDKENINGPQLNSHHPGRRADRGAAVAADTREQGYVVVTDGEGLHQGMVEVDKKGCVIVYRGPNEPVRFGEILVVAVAPDVEGELFTFCDICFAALDGQHL
jgi:hypothetical protein